MSEGETMVPAAAKALLESQLDWRDEKLTSSFFWKIKVNLLVCFHLLVLSGEINAQKG